jgi:hypothetical protein
MTPRRIAVLLLVVGAAAACALNPQPLPPGTEPQGDAGPGGFGEDLGSDASMRANPVVNDAGLNSPAPPDGATGGQGGDAGPAQGAGDASSTDAMASDAATDAGEARDAEADR